MKRDAIAALGTGTIIGLAMAIAIAVFGGAKYCI